MPSVGVNECATVEEFQACCADAGYGCPLAADAPVQYTQEWLDAHHSRISSADTKYLAKRGRGSAEQAEAAALVKLHYPGKHGGMYDHGNCPEEISLEEHVLRHLAAVAAEWCAPAPLAVWAQGRGFVPPDCGCMATPDALFLAGRGGGPSALAPGVWAVEVKCRMAASRSSVENDLQQVQHQAHVIASMLPPGSFAGVLHCELRDAAPAGPGPDGEQSPPSAAADPQRPGAASGPPRGEDCTDGALQALVITECRVGPEAHLLAVAELGMCQAAVGLRWLQRHNAADRSPAGLEAAQQVLGKKWTAQRDASGRRPRPRRPMVRPEKVERRHRQLRRGSAAAEFCTDEVLADEDPFGMSEEEALRLPDGDANVRSLFGVQARKRVGALTAAVKGDPGAFLSLGELRVWAARHRAGPSTLRRMLRAEAAAVDDQLPRLVGILSAAIRGEQPPGPAPEAEAGRQRQSRGQGEPQRGAPGKCSHKDAATGGDPRAAAAEPDPVAVAQVGHEAPPADPDAREVTGAEPLPPPGLSPELIAEVRALQRPGAAVGDAVMLPAGLASAVRQEVHAYARSLGLSSSSCGKGDERRVVVSVPPSGKLRGCRASAAAE
eukprot:TRINITY_DN31042_c0_g1_i4.p1 TRINITY_DN31042_c0_g1~~TRINITY_DN31042_c0_g1_i4.p1  ORF type:complete len:641 (+),score=142.09 TRINITY_DN31042_c0_g1_i4:100-1923(+)